jgi:hypothetical protein
MRRLLGLGLLLGITSLTLAQGIVIPSTMGTAYLVNRTGKTIRFVISSERGVHSDVLFNNAAGITYFQGNRTRVITVYEVGNPTAPPIVNEPIALESGVTYEILSIVPLAPYGGTDAAPGKALRSGSSLRKLKGVPPGLKSPGTAPKTAP